MCRASITSLRFSPHRRMLCHHAGYSYARLGALCGICVSVCWSWPCQNGRTDWDIVWTLEGRLAWAKNPHVGWSACWRHMANTMDRSAAAAMRAVVAINAESFHWPTCSTTLPELRLRTAIRIFSAQCCFILVVFVIFLFIVPYCRLEAQLLMPYRHWDKN